MSEADLHPLQPGGAPLPARAALAALGLSGRPAPGARPRVAVAMVASADGRAAIDGRSGPLGHPADRALFRELRTAADALLVGTGTLRAERYATVLDDDQRAHRETQGRDAVPLLATIARTLDVPDDIPLFGEPAQRIAVYTEAEGDVAGHGAQVSTHRLAEASPGAVLAHLGEHHGAGLVLCEGGPSLLHAMVAAGCVDDLFLTVAPLLAAGDDPRTLIGAPLRPPAALRLAGAWRGGDHLFLHYEAP